LSFPAAKISRPQEQGIDILARRLPLALRSRPAEGGHFAELRKNAAFTEWQAKIYISTLAQNQPEKLGFLA
jgi:hypothetical protein